MKFNRFIAIVLIIIWTLSIIFRHWEYHVILNGLLGGAIGAAFARLWISDVILYRNDWGVILEGEKFDE